MEPRLAVFINHIRNYRRAAVIELTGSLECMGVTGSQGSRANGGSQCRSTESKWLSE